MTPGDIEDLLLQYEADVAVWARTPDKYNYAEVLDSRKKITALLESRVPSEAGGSQAKTITKLCDRLDRIHRLCNGTMTLAETVLAIEEMSGGFMPVPAAPPRGGEPPHDEHCDVNDPIIKGKPCNCRNRVPVEPSTDSGDGG